MQDQSPGPPSMVAGMHHTGYVTRDAGATADFYTRIMGMPLVRAVVDNSLPSTGDPYPYLHLFFQMGDGSTLAYFESPDLPLPAESTHPGYEVFNHIALKVNSKEEIDRWAEHLRANGVEVVGPSDHKVIYSIYFRDPSGLRLEVTTDTDDTWRDHAEPAKRDLETWLNLRAEAARTGDDSAFRAWLKSRGRHLFKPQPAS